MIVAEPLLQTLEQPSTGPRSRMHGFDQPKVIPVILHAAAPGMEAEVFGRTLDTAQSLTRPRVAAGETGINGRGVSRPSDAARHRGDRPAQLASYLSRAQTRNGAALPGSEPPPDGVEHRSGDQCGIVAPHGSHDLNGRVRIPQRGQAVRDGPETPAVNPIIAPERRA